MFEKVLIPLDFSDDSQYAVQCIHEIPEVGQVVLLHVAYTKYPSKNSGVRDQVADYAGLRLEKIQKSLETRGMHASIIIEEITGGEILDVVNRIVEKEGITLTLMARRGRGAIDTLLLGSVASDVLHYGKSDLILVCYPGARGKPLEADTKPCSQLFSNVLICTDFSEPETGILTLRKIPGIGKATIIHVVTTGNSQEEIQHSVDTARERLEELKEKYADAGIPLDIHVRVGSAAEEIISVAGRENFSLIVLKSTGKRGLRTLFTGSTTAYVGRKAGNPILIFRRSSSL